MQTERPAAETAHEPEGASLKVVLSSGAVRSRRCGSCTLCCRLLPVASIGKPSLTRCSHQRATGCRVYGQTAMPPDCRLWSCRWLVDEEAARLRRPDRGGYVVDIMPDVVRFSPDDGAEPFSVQVVQVWVDPSRPEAHRDRALRDYLAECGARHGMAALIRFDSELAMLLMPPALSASGEWEETSSNLHTAPQGSFWPDGLRPED